MSTQDLLVLSAPFFGLRLQVFLSPYSYYHYLSIVSSSPPGASLALHGQYNFLDLSLSAHCSPPRGSAAFSTTWFNFSVCRVPPEPDFPLFKSPLTCSAGTGYICHAGHLIATLIDLLSNPGHGQRPGVWAGAADPFAESHTCSKESLVPRGAGSPAPKASSLELHFQTIGYSVPHYTCIWGVIV